VLLCMDPSGLIQNKWNGMEWFLKATGIFWIPNNAGYSEKLSVG